MARAAGVRVLLREERLPAVAAALLDEAVHMLPLSGVECEVVQPGKGALVPAAAQGRGLFGHDVAPAEPPAAPEIPVLVRSVAETFQNPAPLSPGTANVGDPQLDVVQGSDRRSLHGASL